MLAIISDTHLPRGMRELPEACLEQLRQAEAIIHAGDFIAYDIYEFMTELNEKTYGVCGNCDDSTIRNTLPDTRIVNWSGKRIAMIHDAGPTHARVQRLRQMFPNADAVVFGHSHWPDHQTDGDFQIFNPGSATDPRRAPHPTMGAVSVQNGRLHFEHIQLD